LKIAHLAFENKLFSPCLQNVQQSVEKSLKAMVLHLGHDVRRTHSIVELASHLRQIGAEVELQDEECELFYSIFRPSRYPPDSALPDSMPDERICIELVATADRVFVWARGR